jgi:hypothetical protein
MLHEMLIRFSQPPWWLVSTFSTILGTVAGFFCGLVSQWIVLDRLGTRNMRRVLYRDLAQMFWTVDRFMNTQPEIGALHSDPLLWQQDQFRKFLFFQGEKYCLENPAIYMQLPERFAGQTLYRRFHCILEDPLIAVNLNTHSAVAGFAHYVHEGVLERKYFRRFLSKQQFRDLLLRVDYYYRQSEKGIHDIYARQNAQVTVNDDSSGGTTS